MAMAGSIKLPASLCEPCESGYARRLIHFSESPLYSALAMVWGPGQGTSVHDHCGMWCVEGVIDGLIVLLDAFRAKGLPIIYTTTPFQRGLEPANSYSILGKEVTPDFKASVQDSIRIITARRPPKSIKTTMVTRYWIPITLWSVLNRKYLLHPSVPETET